MRTPDFTDEFPYADPISGQEHYLTTAYTVDLEPDSYMDGSKECGFYHRCATVLWVQIGFKKLTRDEAIAIFGPDEIARAERHVSSDLTEREFAA